MTLQPRATVEFDFDGRFTITYARSRLWLGISGVGAIVVISVALLISKWPLAWLPEATSWSVNDIAGLLGFIGVWVVVMTPLDVLGGFVLPNRSRPNTITAPSFARGWVRGVILQAIVFVAVSLAILTMGRSLGVLGAALAVVVIAMMLVEFQLLIARLTASLASLDVEASGQAPALESALLQTSQWGWDPRPIVVVEHQDTGFTGGVVGLPGMESIVLPADSLAKLSPDQLATTIARRLEAIRSGGRTRGILVALAWVVLGFVLAASLPGAGVSSVGELAMTYLGFTLWSFVGLLTLPTLSRQASYAIDRKVIDRGASPQTLRETVQTLDRLQDDEPKRSAFIETIFHPVPSVDNRRGESAGSIPIAWHAARMTLFVSWACAGTLVRAVHCNVGRPELWVLLPTD